MAYQEFVKLLAEQADLTTVEINRFIEAFRTTIIEELKTNQSVAVPGLGQFELMFRKARTGRHPQTGQPLALPAQTTLHFRPSAPFKRLVNP